MIRIAKAKAAAMTRERSPLVSVMIPTRDRSELPAAAIEGGLGSSIEPVGKPSAETVLPDFSILIALLCLAASGCADLAATDSVGRPQVATPPPDEKKLAELVGSAFKMAKFSGAPEVSPLRATHDTQIGDWTFCIRSSAPSETLQYAVFIKDNSLLDIRSRVAIDGCNDETYRPIEIASSKATPADDHAATPPPPSPGRHRRRAQ